MFIQGTEVFTDSGYKKIEDISGHDKVLVRNFLGDASFIQPFALKKKDYEGEIIKIGARDWSITVTPEHMIAVGGDRYQEGVFTSVPAKDYKPRHHKYIYRKFRYSFSESPKPETIIRRDEFGRHSVTVSPQDWYKLVGFVLMRGFIRMKPGRPMLYIFLEEERIVEEVAVLKDILDRIGLGWHVQYSEKTRAKLVVSSKNNLASKIIKQLGSKKRKEMFLPDKMIYQTNKSLAKLLIDTIIETSIKPTTERKSIFQIATTNIALIKSLTLLGTLNGYSMRCFLTHKAGTVMNHGVTKKDCFMLQIANPTDTYSTSYIKKLKYSGRVYSIDLFQGQVYIKEKSVPVWVDPK